jgi:hypothetical protein
MKTSATMARILRDRAKGKKSLAQLDAEIKRKRINKKLDRFALSL